MGFWIWSWCDIGGSVMELKELEWIKVSGEQCVCGVWCGWNGLGWEELWFCMGWLVGCG